ncbi:ABC transporter related [Beutenbergia cavernae DSM 12333]|uniref:ABC transporter related n=1 Tax=Beutenbergia cavernae (strain ATCC BAA-8 / DSM 12333 / CCUG 43141 / JCM 11478 / NBRC 16432 / NCIMB 13614 / HKI 0122) TaxID=471853 RepID=C5BVT1_BEUC1|nr:ABC transporter ATP-binding protein [Beutenbergia cavernae]ACQ78521.1 ABC transporter related [Beutenbergia cavernae DSM 12333]
MADLPLQVRDLVRTFPGGAGLHGIDLDVAPGSVHALVGLNGAGKTTLMKAVLGMLRPTSGTVRVFGADAAAARWDAVGHVVAGAATYAELTLRSNLLAAARWHGLAGARAGDAVDRLLDELDLARYARVRTSRLSDGNRQRLALAGALVHDPALVVLDEPTNTLDPSGVVLLRETLLRRVAVGAAVLVSSHHLDEVARIADRITVINRGRVVGALDPRGLDIEREFFAIVHDDDQRASR